MEPDVRGERRGGIMNCAIVCHHSWHSISLRHGAARLVPRTFSRYTSWVIDLLFCHAGHHLAATARRQGAHAGSLRAWSAYAALIGGIPDMIVDSASCRLSFAIGNKSVLHSGP